MKNNNGPLKTFEVTFIPWDCGASFITTSPGKARYLYWIENQDVFDLRFRELLPKLKVKCLGLPITSDEFKKNAEYRQISFAYCGMMVKVGDETGYIVGHNSSANLDVLFRQGKYAGQVLNCHPHSEIEYFSSAGALIKSFKKDQPTQEPAINF